MSEAALLKILMWFIPSSTTLALIAVLLYLFSHPEKFDQWGRLIYRFLGFIADHLGRYSASAWKYVERGTVAWDVQAVVNTVSGTLNQRAPGALPYVLKVEWVKGIDDEMKFARDGEAIVRLRRHSNRDTNIINVTLAYLSIGLLPRARLYMDNLLRCAVDYTVAKSIFAAQEDSSVATHFLENVALSEIEKEPALRDDMDLLDDLKEKGSFTRILLSEVHQFGEWVFPATPNSAMAEEIRAFASYLWTIATKQTGEYVPLDFDSPRFKVAVVLVAEESHLARVGLGGYIRRINLLIREGFPAIYISGRGEEYVRLIRQMVKEIKRSGKLRIVRSEEFPLPPRRGVISRGIITVCHTSNAYFVRLRERNEVVRKVLAKHVPEIRDGETEIVTIVREPRVGTKVAVRMTAEHEDPWAAVIACVGKSNERIDAIKRELPRGEWIGLINWSPDLELYISQALYPMSASDVTNIELDELELEAIVKVKDEVAYSRAVGKGGENVRLASELVGWRINVEIDQEYAAQAKKVTELVWTAFARNVPEIASGEVKIVRIAREPGFGAKVAVRKTVEIDRGPSALEICIGKQHKRFEAIRAELPSDEYLRIMDWDLDTESFIKSALWPLEVWDILQIEVDKAASKAVVVAKDESAAGLGIGRHGNNVRLAEQLTGYDIDVESAKGSK